MLYPHFIGQTYESQAVTADQERTVNWYPERLEMPGATSRLALYPTPGVELVVQTNSTAGRAHIYISGREFMVIGTSFIDIDEDAAVTYHGTLAIDTNPATISSNGDGGGELFITSGGNGYLFVLATNTLSTIAALNGKATMGDQLDGYFLALDANTGTLYSSALLDGATWTTGVMFAQRNAAPDPWISMKVVGPYIWLFGEQTSEVWYDAGNSPFPFAKHPSGLVQYGIAAAFSAAVCDSSLIWLGSTKSGHGFVLRSSGFSPEVVSTYPVQLAIIAQRTDRRIQISFAPVSVPDFFQASLSKRAIENIPRVNIQSKQEPFYLFRVLESPDRNLPDTFLLPFSHRQDNVDAVAAGAVPDIAHNFHHRIALLAECFTKVRDCRRQP